MKHPLAILLVGSALAAAPASAQIPDPVQARQAAAAASTSTPVPASATPGAPSATAATDDVFARARRLMAAGQDDSGRALVQGELNAADSGSARYVEALYWRAVLARTAADAERDLRTIVIEYPLSAQSDDALMRLAQLEMTRGENDRAMGHLERVVREHSRSASRPRASFWMARLLFDKGDTPGACAKLADAAATTPAAQIELRNQIDYLAPRCAGVDTSAAPTKPAAPARATAPTKAVATIEPTAPAKPAAPAARQSNGFTVQVAALSSRESAERIRQRLTQLGYESRIAGSEPPFRVRVGRYATRDAADSVAARMKTQHVDGYVTQAEPRR